MDKWFEATVGDVLTLQRGFDITRDQQQQGIVPVVSSGGIASFHGTAMVKGPGVVIGRKGTLGKVFFLDGPYWPHDTTLWVKDFKGSWPRFVYYFMKQLDVSFLDVGSANPTLNRNHVHPLRVSWPPAAEQHAIAEVLGALDDKIAANTNLASTAEALANALFAEAVQGVDLSDDTFDDVSAVGGGGTPRTGVDEYWDGDINWVTPTDVTALSGPYLESTSRRITKEGLDACASPLYPQGSILMTSRATIGAFAVAQEATATNQGFIVVNPHDSSLKWWIFHEMRSRVDEFISLANGATFLELSRGNFRKFQVRLADEFTMKDFGVTVDALHSRARQAFVENTRLAASRDVLLPRLMSGRIRVKDAEQMVGDVV